MERLDDNGGTRWGAPSTANRETCLWDDARLGALSREFRSAKDLGVYPESYRSWKLKFVFARFTRDDSRFSSEKSDEQEMPALSLSPESSHSAEPSDTSLPKTFGNGTVVGIDAKKTKRTRKPPWQRQPAAAVFLHQIMTANQRTPKSWRT